MALLHEELFETVARGGARGAVFDHLSDFARRARRLDDAGGRGGQEGLVGVAASGAVVGLHEAGLWRRYVSTRHADGCVDCEHLGKAYVEVGVLCSDHSDTSCGFLHDCGQDEAGINAA